MTTTTTTTNMNLTLPIVGVEIGPAWATELNAAFNLVDSHDHTTNKGTRIPVAGLNMNATLSLGNFDLTNVLNVGMKNNGSPLSAVTYKTSLSASSGELYYNDNSGNSIKITNAGGLNLTSIGQIGGDYSTSTASLSYTTAGTTFTFTSSTGIYAKVNVGDFKIFERVSSGKYVEFKTVTSLASNYSLVLPTALPASTLPMVCDASGNLSFSTITLAQLDPGALAVTLDTISTDYTAVLADQNKMVQLTGSVAHTLTIPPNSSVAFPLGTQIFMYQDGTGALSVVAGGGVTIRSELGLKLNAQYSMAAALKVATDTWILTGALKA